MEATTTSGSATAFSSSWNVLDLQAIVDGRYSGPQPRFLIRDDGLPLLYAGAVHSIAGAPGSGKSWVALVAAAQLINADRNVLYIDFEDSPHTAVSRLKALNLDPIKIALRLGYVRPDEPLPDHLPDVFSQWLNAVDLVVVDGVTNALESHGLDPLSNRDAAEFMNRFVHRLVAGELGPAVLLIDHVPKAKSNRGSPIGAQHKLAAVQVQYMVSTVIPFDQDHDGSLDIVLAKDRFGEVQRRLPQRRSGGPVAARIHFRHDDELGVLTTQIDPPGGSTSDDALRNEIIRVVTASPGITKTELVKSVRGNNSRTISKVNELAEIGVLRTERNGNSIAHFCNPD